MNLIEIGFPGHERLAQQQLAQDAAGGPEINGGGVRVATEEELGAAVPKGNHLGSDEKAPGED